MKAACAAAKATAFPRGLVQPPGSYRFAADSLLLACFCRADAGHRLLDLGTGCGVVALGLLLRQPQAVAVGLDAERELIEAARRNAALLGLEGRFTALCRDLAGDNLFRKPGRPGAATPPALEAAAFDLAVANPPYRQRQAGRLPASRLRLEALFEKPETLPLFCRAAFRALKPGGRFAVLYAAARRQHLLCALEQAGFAPSRLLPVAPRQGEAATRILVEAVSPGSGLDSNPGLGPESGPEPLPEPRPESEGEAVRPLTQAAAHEQQRAANPEPSAGSPAFLELPPLILHGDSPETGGRAGRFSSAALEFCPFLDTAAAKARRG